MNSLVGWDHGTPLEECDKCWALGGLMSDAGSDFRLSYARRTVDHFSRRLPTTPLTVRGAIIRHVHKDDREKFKAMVDKIPPPARDLWLRVSETWYEAEGWRARVVSFARSLLSGKRATQEQRELRHISCFGIRLDGTYVAPSCPMVRAGKDGHHYCGACGCGENRLAQLDGPNGKLGYTYLKCPLARPGFSNHKETP